MVWGNYMKIRNSIFLTSAAVVALASAPGIAQKETDSVTDDAVNVSQPESEV